MTHSILLPSPKEQSLGFRYCIFATVFLPSLLSLLATVFQRQLHILALNMAYFCINFTVLACFFRRFLLKSLQSLVGNWKKVALTALGGLALYLLATWLLSLMITRISPDFYNRNDSSIGLMAEKSLFFTAFGTVFLVPVAEECMFRGAVFGSIYRKSPLFAVIFSTVLFSLVHIDGFFGLADGKILFLSFLQYLPAGIILSTAYICSSSIFAPIFIHMAVNALGILALR